MRLYHLLFLLLFLCKAQSQTNDRPSTASKQVSTFTLESPQLGTSKKIWVWSPKDYDKSEGKYAVLYMHDAQNVFDAKTSYAGEWNVDETLDSLDARVIVIAIEHGNDKRIDELTPFPNAKYGGGNADAYLDFLVNTVKPEVDKRYRTKTDVKNTGIMGSSLGGLVSFYAVLRYPGIFGKAGVFSPAFWFSDKNYTFAEKSRIKDKKLYFLCGTKEDEHMEPDMLRMIEIVRKKEAEKLIKHIVINGGEHNEKLWREHFADAFLWLYK